MFLSKQNVSDIHIINRRMIILTCVSGILLSLLFILTVYDLNHLSYCDKRKDVFDLLSKESVDKLHSINERVQKNEDNK